MTTPDASDLFEVIEETWPPATILHIDGWRILEGRGGGQRVSSANILRDNARIEDMEAAQARLGQAPLVMVRPGDDALDNRLEAAGYARGDETAMMVAKVSDVVGATDPVSIYPSLPPLAVQHELWTKGGVGPERWAVMKRGSGITLLGRMKDRPVATAFLGLTPEIAMIHALEVAADARRQGIGRAMMRGAANWVTDQYETGDWVSVLVVRENTAALALYESLGFREVGGYHYRRNVAK